MRDATQEAELFALLAVSKARDIGQIKKRNINKLDHKVNVMITNYLHNDGIQYQRSLPESIQTHRMLPEPATSATHAPKGG